MFFYLPVRDDAARRMRVRGGAGGQERADVHALRRQVEVGIEVVMRLVGVVLHHLRRDGFQGGKQPLRAPFAFCLVGRVVVSERVRRGVAQPEQVFQFESASGGDAVGDAVVAAVGRAAVVFFVYVLAGGSGRLSGSG